MGVNINEDRDRTRYEASRPKAPKAILSQASLPTLAQVTALAGVPMQVYELAEKYQVYVQKAQSGEPKLPVNYGGAQDYCNVRGSHGFTPTLRGVVVSVQHYQPTEVLASISYEK